MERIQKKLEEAQKTIRTASHLIYVTFPLVNDKKILLKTTLEAKKAIALCINAILQYEYLYKRIRLYKHPKQNLQIFIEKSAPRFKITREETRIILELFDIAEKHKKSPMEFQKGDSVVILSDEMHPRKLTLEETKKFIEIAQLVLNKAVGSMNFKRS